MPVNYQLGKIYKVVNTENDFVYYGSTAQQYLSSRMGSNRNQCKGSATNTPFIEAVVSGVCVYNQIRNGKHSDETKAKMRDAHKGKKHSAETKAKMSASIFKRGTIRPLTMRLAFEFEWKWNGVPGSKTFGFGPRSKRTREEAYLKCIELREKMFPLQTIDYLAELPCNID